MEPACGYTSVNIQNIPTPIMWLGALVTGGGAGPLPGIKESESGQYILDSEDGQRIIPSAD